MVPPSVDDAAFTSATQAIRELQARNLARLLVGADNAVQIEIIEGDEAKQLLEERRLDPEAVRGTGVHVASILTAILDNLSSEEYAKERGGTGPEQEALSRQYSFVGEQFPLAPLRRRAWLKQTTKNQVARVFDWEVSVKLHDSTVADGDRGHAPLPYGTIRLTTESAVDVLSDRETAITVDEEDVGYLLDSLTRLQACMRSAAGAQGT